MNNNLSAVLNFVVKNDICIGCGACIYACRSKAISMEWNSQGFLVPFQSGSCNEEGYCLKVCPFNPTPEGEVKTEDELSDLFLKDAKFKDEKVGRYTGLYAGYSYEFRLTSSSGGIATYMLSEMLNSGAVNYIVSVNDSNRFGFHYEYSVIKNKQELLSSSKTKYYPVTLATALHEIDLLNGKIAIVGVGCFIKAMRLLQYYNPALKKKIVFLVGIICGGVKSKFFTEYLSEKSGVLKTQTILPEYRVKDINSIAIDYSFRCQNRSTKEIKEIKMRSIGDMWGTGLFKSNACDFCDDVTTELADVSLGDAWINPYKLDGSGTNIIITRSLTADILIKKSFTQGKICIDQLKLDNILESQRGNYNHRYYGLPFRIKILQHKNKLIIKRHKHQINPISLSFKLVQLIRMKIRKQSLRIWHLTNCSHDFDNTIKRNLFLLRIFTKLYHIEKSLRSKV